MELGELILQWDLDECIAPIVKALNDAGIQTIESCCGHDSGLGTIDLLDGRRIMVIKAEYFDDEVSDDVARLIKEKEALREAGRWVLNVTSDAGASQEEIVEAMDALRATVESS